MSMPSENSFDVRAVCGRHLGYLVREGFDVKLLFPVLRFAGVDVNVKKPLGYHCPVATSFHLLKGFMPSLLGEHFLFSVYPELVAEFLSDLTRHCDALLDKIARGETTLNVREEALQDRVAIMVMHASKFRTGPLRRTYDGSRDDEPIVKRKKSAAVTVANTTGALRHRRLAAAAKAASRRAVAARRRQEEQDQDERDDAAGTYHDGSVEIFCGGKPVPVMA
jgi:hypothetical protein